MADKVIELINGALIVPAVAFFIIFIVVVSKEKEKLE